MPVTSQDTVAVSDVLTGAVAFTDICGFTEFTAVRGDADALQLLAAQERLVRHCLPPGARVVKELGDGLMLWFPDAEAALLSTLALQDEFEVESSTTELPLWVRIGLHWGTPARRGEDLIGHDVNIASRVVDVAGPTEVVVTDQLLSQVSALDVLVGIDVEELGPVVMKGLPDPVRLFRVARAWLPT
ncbi:MAG TPA: adenylate/guanylate cyclase domain-containing protein [Acidimicrobiales bacterium]|jgi:adenylate cyclase